MVTEATGCIAVNGVSAKADAYFVKKRASNSDTKPANATNGSRCYEMDPANNTLTIYCFDADPTDGVGWFPIAKLVYDDE